MASSTEISRLDYIEKEKLEKILSLVDLDSDVLSILIDKPSDGQILVYDGTAKKWKNATVVMLPSVSSDDNGKVLKVVEGVWTAVEETESEPVV